MTSDKEDICGISKWWGWYGDFLPGCRAHDQLFTQEELNPNQIITRKQVDDYFLEKMLQIADDNTWMKVKAYAVYSAARALGWIYW